MTVSSPENLYSFSGEDHASSLLSILPSHFLTGVLAVLTEAMSVPSQGDTTRMNAYNDLLWAYADTGKVDAATTLAQDSLAVMPNIRSTTNVSRIIGLHGQLSSLGSSNIEVIRLGVMLRG